MFRNNEYIQRIPTKVLSYFHYCVMNIFSFNNGLFLDIISIQGVSQ